MIKKSEIVSVLIDYGLPPIEADRVTENKENFELGIQAVIDQILFEERNK